MGATSGTYLKYAALGQAPQSQGGGGGGSVTSVTVATSGLTNLYTVVNPTVTTAGTITLQANTNNASTSTFWRGDGTWASVSSGAPTSAYAGSVSNVTFTGDGTVLSSTPSAAVSTVGTLNATLLSQGANQFLSGPQSGTSANPVFRPIANQDLPAFLSFNTLQANQMVITDGSGRLQSQAMNILPQISPPLFLFDDFYSINASPIGQLGWKTSTQGAGVSVGFGVSTTGHPGVLQVNTGTASTGYAVVYIGDSVNASNLPDGAIIWESLIKIGNLSSSAAQGFTFSAGLGDAVLSGAQPNCGVYFFYNQLNGVNWQAVTSLNGTSTVTDTGIAVTNVAWTKLMWISTSAANSVDFYINGTKVVSGQNTNIPTSAMPYFNLVKNVGNTNRSMTIDYFRMYQVFNNPRL